MNGSNSISILKINQFVGRAVPDNYIRRAKPALQKCTFNVEMELQRMAVVLADEIFSGKSVSARCRELSAKPFSPEAAVKQIAAALVG